MEDQSIPVSLQRSNLGFYSAPPTIPHFRGMSFRVPREYSEAGVVIYVSGLSKRVPQPLVLAITPDFLYLGDGDEVAWWKSYQSIRRVDTVETSVGVPVPTPGGGTVDLYLNSAKAIRIGSASAYGGEINLILATLHPQHASEWVASIDQARIDYEERNRRAGKRQLG